MSLFFFQVMRDLLSKRPKSEKNREQESWQPSPTGKQAGSAISLVSKCPPFLSIFSFVLCPIFVPCRLEKHQWSFRHQASTQQHILYSSITSQKAAPAAQEQLCGLMFHFSCFPEMLNNQWQILAAQHGEMSPKQLSSPQLPVYNLYIHGKEIGRTEDWAELQDAHLWSCCHINLPSLEARSLHSITLSKIIHKSLKMYPTHINREAQCPWRKVWENRIKKEVLTFLLGLDDQGKSFKGCWKKEVSFFWA